MSIYYQTKTPTKFGMYNQFKANSRPGLKASEEEGDRSLLAESVMTTMGAMDSDDEDRPAVYSTQSVRVRDYRKKHQNGELLI